MSAFDTLSAVPCAITQGEAVAWAETFTDYPAASYGVAYKFAGQTPVDGFQQFAVAGVGSGSTFTFTTAATLKPGIYGWERQVTRTSDSVMRVTARGKMTVRPNFATAQTTSQAALDLAALNTAIQTLTTSVNQSVSFNGQSYSKANLATYIEQRRSLQAEVDREQQALAALNGDARSGQVAVRFTPAQPYGGPGSYPFGNGGCCK